MTTKKYRNIFSYIAALTISLFIVSCDQEDNTGYSTLVPTSPTLSVTTDANATLIEDDSVFEFTATLSVAQLVDTKLSISQIAGNAKIGDDFTVDGSITIPAGATSATGSIKILSDELKEGTETVKIQIGDITTANAALTPVTMEFTILNYTEGDLAFDLSWAMASITTDDAGEEIDPEDFADLRLLITTAPNNTDIYKKVDESGFESFVMEQSTPDGDYYIVADFYKGNDIDRDLDLNIVFNQVGLYNNLSEDYSAVLNTTLACPAVYHVLVKIIKSGTNYTIERIGESPEPTVYATTTYDVVSNGETTDYDYPLVDFATTATITNNGDGTYTLSDAWAGVYIEWYSNYDNTDEEPQTFSITACNTFTAEWDDIFGGGNWLSGEVNPEDGTITVRVDNVYGDYADQIYTPSI